MSADTLLSVCDVSKKYCRELNRALWYGLVDFTQELMPRGSSRRTGLRAHEFWALQDVSFTLQRGEALAIVGDNGAGKSTLLKLLHGLLKPDAGEIRIRGRVGAIIELGTGLNGELTGRENVALGATLHGLNAALSQRLLDEVVAFSELGHAIDAPLQTYSSGMKARLAYALQAHLQPDLLLVDEALAVGDVNFQRKCVNHMRHLLSQGSALLLVSHNTYQIQAVCDRGMLLEQGRVGFRGTAVEAVQCLLQRRGSSTPSVPAEASVGPVSIDAVSVAPACGAVIEMHQPLTVRVRYEARESTQFVWGFSIWTQDQWVCVTGSLDETVRVARVGVGELACTLPNLRLLPGHYVLRVAMLEPQTLQPLALYGWSGAGAAVHVTAQPAALTNLQMQQNQLVSTDVEWR